MATKLEEEQGKRAVNVLFSVSEYRKIAALAKASDWKVATYVRRIVRDHINAVPQKPRRS